MKLFSAMTAGECQKSTGNFLGSLCVPVGSGLRAALWRVGESSGSFSKSGVTAQIKFKDDQGRTRGKRLYLKGFGR